MKLAQAAQMQGIDRTAINDIGIPGVVLMENAGRETAKLLCQHFGVPHDREVVIFAGPGNNAGDGFVIARHLQEMGADVVIYLLVEPSRIKGDALVNLDIVRRLGIPYHLALDGDDIKKIRLTTCFAVVDALFGTGLKREIKGHFADAVQLINNAPCPVIAVDIASGIDSDTGIILGTAVQAELTATYGVAKPGHFVYPGRSHSGVLHIIDIGIPSRVIKQAMLHHELLDADTVRTFMPSRSDDSHKGSHGHLLIVAGAIGKTGAGILSGLGALRAGAGLVSLCVADRINAVFESALHEAMTIPVKGGEHGAPVFDDFEAILGAMEGKQAAVLGPGCGTAEDTARLIRKIYREVNIPLVIDADGLNILSARPGDLTTANAVRILTPHPGEMARMTGRTSRDIQQNRLHAAKEFAAEHNVFLVLKGAGTIIAAPDGSIAINSSGNAGMAAGGMGDVLSGIIGALLVQRVEPWQACCLGVFIHGLAADLPAEKKIWGYSATDVAEMIPIVLTTLFKQH